MTAQKKYDLRPLFRVNFVDPDRSRGRAVAAALVQLGLPVVSGVGLGLWVSFGLDIQNGVSVALPASSLLVGAMFGAFVFLTNLRVKLAESATFAFRSDLQRYVGAAAAACLYLALICIVFAGMLALVGSLPGLRTPELTPWVVGTLFAVAVHTGLILATVIRRLFIIYVDMFASDFNARVPQSGEAAVPQVSEEAPRGVIIQPTRRSKRLFRG
jgi:hypothetical protein